MTDGGIGDLIKIIEASYENQKYGVYFYCIGLIGPMVFDADILKAKDQNEWVKSHSEILEEIDSKNYVSILTEHLIHFYDRKSSQLKFLAPLLLGLKSLA